MLEVSIAGMPGQSATQSRLEFELLWLTLGKMRRGSLIPKYDRSDKEKRVWSWPGRSAERQCGGHAGSREVGPSGMRVGVPQAPDLTWATAPMSFHSQTFPYRPNGNRWAGPGYSGVCTRSAISPQQLFLSTEERCFVSQQGCSFPCVRPANRSTDKRSTISTERHVPQLALR